MKNEFFNIKDTLFDITDKYPETIDIFVAHGFEEMKDEKKRQTLGKALSLEMALKSKKVNVDTFAGMLIECIDDTRLNIDSSLQTEKKTKEVDIRIEGVLPCPVKTPLLESLEGWIEKNKDMPYTIEYDLKSASMGVDWLKEALQNTDDEKNIPDLFMSAGFDLFFDEELMGKFKKKGVFADLTDFEKFNEDFDNDEIDLKDPDRQYSMIGVVPAVFLVNVEELNGREIPKTWEDILKEEFENSVSLPIGDFDLFNAILLNVQKRYGDEAVKKLGKSLLRSMHPSEMVKSHTKKNSKPAVTIMPYFFTKMIRGNGPMQAVWPEDGAIISPIFLLSKSSKKEALKPLVDFFVSKEIGEVLSHNGRFPSINPEVDNRTGKVPYMWLGWDYIKQNDIGKLIRHCEAIFNESI